MNAFDRCTDMPHAQESRETSEPITILRPGRPGLPTFDPLDTLSWISCEKKYPRTEIALSLIALVPILALQLVCALLGTGIGKG